MSRLLCIFAAIVAAIPAVVLGASDGDLDPSFGDGGHVTTWVSAAGDAASAVLPQADGKVVAAGFAFETDHLSYNRKHFALLRYEADGSIDPSFGVGGRVETSVFPDGDDGPLAFVQQADGQLVAAGHTHVQGVTQTGVYRDETYFALVRWTADGIPDPSFGTDGRIVLPFGAVGSYTTTLVAQPDGSFVGGGGMFAAKAYVLVRYDGQGHVDGSFGSGGVVDLTLDGSIDQHFTLIRQTDGLLVGVGSVSTADGNFFVVARWLPDGTPDDSFGMSGLVLTPVRGGVARSVIQQDDGRLVVMGNTYRDSDCTLVRYLPDGSLDESFGDGGVVIVDLTGQRDYDGALAAVQQHADGKLVVLAFGAGVVRFNVDGSIDPSFGDAGKSPAPIGIGGVDGLGVFRNEVGFAQQADGKVLVVTSSNHFTVWRMLTADESDSDGDGIADSVDPCTNDGTRYASRAALVTSRLGEAPGNHTLRLSGVVTVPTTPAIDPRANGLRVLYGDGGETGTIFDVTVPPGGWDRRTRTGWRGDHGDFRYANGDGSSQVYRVHIKRQSNTPGRYAVLVKGRHGDYVNAPGRLPPNATIVFDVPSATTGQCGEWRFAPAAASGPGCRVARSGGVVRCR